MQPFATRLDLRFTDVPAGVQKFATEDSEAGSLHSETGTAATHGPGCMPLFPRTC